MAAPNISLLNATYSGVKGVTLPKQGGGTATFPWVEGSETKTANGTYDVTNLAELVVNVSGGGGGAVVVTDTTDVHGGTIREITAVDISDTTLSSASQMLSGVKAYKADGTAVTGSIATKTSADLTASGDTVTVPSGYYASAATKAVASGTAGTPTASKGAVNNHSISVTPSVTNTTGYITGSTKTGTAVTVSASELVSGSETKTANGTYDVTNLASLVVNVSGGGSVSYDTKTVTASNYPVSLEFTSMKGEPKAFVCRLNAQVSSSGSTTYYYIVDISHFGTTTHGNCFRIGNTRRVDNITSGYSYTYSNGTLTITSSAASRSASPGAFYSGSYELLYCY